MRIAFFLRNASINRFRRAILGALRTSVVDDALMCSGFFQDDHRYSGGAELALHAHRGCVPLSLTTLGIYSYTWRAQYASFFGAMCAANPCKCFSPRQMRLPRMGWHAKVFLAKSGGTPVLAAIGSSNMTRRAFGEFADFNYECDVLMWDEKIVQIDGVVTESIANAGEKLDVVMATYDADHPVNRVPLETRLLALEKEILDMARPA